MSAPAGLLESLIAALGAEGVDVVGLGLAWARVAPTVAIVPAFGLRALPTPARAAMGVLLAASIAPAMRPLAAGQSWVVALLSEVLRGVPLALATAVPLWIATMVGGTIDALRGAGEATGPAVVEGRPTPLGGVFALIASTAFLASGGPARVALAAATTTAEAATPLLRAATSLAAGIHIAVAIAAPLIAASLVIEVALALLGRAATPTNVQALLGLGRGVAVLLVVALLFERLAAATLLLGARSIP